MIFNFALNLKKKTIEKFYSFDRQMEYYVYLSFKNPILREEIQI